MSVVLRERLARQKLAETTFSTPEDVVSWFGAIQAQDFQGAKWAIGLRAKGVTDADVERAYDAGAILRTHVLRPTWHFVAAEDLPWMAALTGPRIIARLAPRHRALAIDPRTVATSERVLARALAEGPLTRAEIAARLRRARIVVTSERLSHLLLVAELRPLICSGPLRAGRLTYALVADRSPRVNPVSREEALARLASRYFRSHGPAAPQDFAWWSGLSVREARLGMESAGVATDTRKADRRVSKRSAWLLPYYDEYLVAYKDRAAIFDGRVVDPRDTLAPTVLIDGVAAGRWSSRRDDRSISIDVSAWRRLSRADRDAIQIAADRYGRFLSRSVAAVRVA